MNSTVLYIVIPCFNEQDVIKNTNQKVSCKLDSMINNGAISEKSGILYVDDGSQDKTGNYIKEFVIENERRSVKDSVCCNIKGIKFARNEGHQNALMAGMKYIYEMSDVVITIDADLQQDIEALDKFIEKYEEGSDIVFGIRNSRDTDKWTKKLSASLFYKVMQSLGTKTIPNHADYRLLSRKAMDNLFKYEETQLFLRGIIADMGFRTSKVYFDVKEREAGESKYTLSRMVHLAMNGITSLSVKPLHMVFNLGVVAVIISIFMIIYNVLMWGRGITVQGWASILCSLWLISGVILIGLGVIGEYIGKLYLEAKKRPLYFIEEEVGEDNE